MAGLRRFGASTSLCAMGRFSHCVVDSFSLKTGEGWKIAMIVYTAETTGCKGRYLPIFVNNANFGDFYLEVPASYPAKPLEATFTPSISERSVICPMRARGDLLTFR